VEAKTWALGEILKPERRYIIPTFQRSYEWTEEKQWRLLFADLVATADRLFQRRLWWRPSLPVNGGGLLDHVGCSRTDEMKEQADEKGSPVRVGS